MKNILYSVALLSIAIMLGSCEEEQYEFGDILTPSNLQVTADIVGTDGNNPNGDGTGVVNFSVSADNAIGYKFIYNGDETISPEGTKTYAFGMTGLHTYSVTIVAIGTAGVTSTMTMDVEVLTLYSPPAELLTMLTGDATRVWRVKNETQGHMGVGPLGATGPIWWSAGPNVKASTAMYDDRYTFGIDGSLSSTTEGFIFGKSVPLTDDYGAMGQTANGNLEFTHYPFGDSNVTWELSAPGGQETLTLTGNGSLGFYVGGPHSYTILSRTADELHLRTIDYTGTRTWFTILVAE